jgi:hypothetical protein
MTTALTLKSGTLLARCLAALPRRRPGGLPRGPGPQPVERHLAGRRSRAARELLAPLLVWEIGKPWRIAQADVDRAVPAVRTLRLGHPPAVEKRATTPTHGWTSVR